MGISLLIWEVTLKFSEESIDFFQERLFKVTHKSFCLKSSKKKTVIKISVIPNVLMK